MQIANTVASKAIVAVVAAAMIFSAFAAPAKAQSVEEMQKMINDLMAQISALQGQGGTSGSVASGVCPFTWTRDLKTGATGDDVMKLQQFLNSNADTRVAASGAGSVGAETMYFGPATAAAVSKFQVMHRADILTPAGLTNPTGFFGPSTRAKANALCVAGGATDEDEDEDEDDNGSDELQGEADLQDASLEDASDDEVEEGSEDAEIAELTVEFQDGDASISRLDVKLDSGDATDAFDVFETVSLWVDGDMVAEMTADDEDEYQDDEKTLRFTGLDIVALEDEELVITIGATLQGSIDTQDQDNFTISVPSMRYFDADGVAETVSGSDFTTDTAVVDVVEAGAEDELTVKSSSEDPDATTLQVEDDAKSDWYTVFVFDLDTEDSTNDIELNTISVKASTTLAAYNTLVDDVELVIDGVTIDDVTIVGGTNTATATTLTFDVDGDVTIDAGDRVSAELKLRFKALASINEGATVKGSIASLDTTVIDAEGAETLEDPQLSGSATGDEHTLRTTGVNVAADSSSAVATDVDGADNDYGTYKITLDVTAFEQDVFVPINAASTSWQLVGANGNVLTVPSASTTVVVESSADEGGAGDAFFEINEGETETVTVTVTFTPGATSPLAARLQLVSLTFDNAGTVSSANDQTWSALPANDYRTSVITIQN